MLAKSFLLSLHFQTTKYILIFKLPSYTFLKGWCIKLKIIVHYPETKEDAEILKKKVAQVHAEAVGNFVSNINCNSEERINLIEEIKNAEGIKNQVK